MRKSNAIWFPALLIVCNIGYAGCFGSGRDHSRYRSELKANHPQSNLRSHIQNETIQYTDREKERRWKRGFVLVTKVIDGDTFWINDGNQEVKVRFIGIDAPETRNSAYKKKGYFGIEAKAYVKELTENKWVRLELDVRPRDQYQRLLAYIYLEDGTFLNAHLVAKGFALVDTHPPNVKYVDQLLDSQIKARQNKLGLWEK